MVGGWVVVVRSESTTTHPDPPTPPAPPPPSKMLTHTRIASLVVLIYMACTLLGVVPTGDNIKVMCECNGYHPYPYLDTRCACTPESDETKRAHNMPPHAMVANILFIVLQLWARCAYKNNDGQDVNIALMSLVPMCVSAMGYACQAQYASTMFVLFMAFFTGTSIVLDNLAEAGYLDADESLSLIASLCESISAALSTFGVVGIDTGITAVWLMAVSATSGYDRTARIIGTPVRNLAPIIRWVVTWADDRELGPPPARNINGAAVNAAAPREWARPQIGLPPARRIQVIWNTEHRGRLNRPPPLQ